MYSETYIDYNGRVWRICGSGLTYWVKKYSRLRSIFLRLTKTLVVIDKKAHNSLHGRHAEYPEKSLYRYDE